jgi:hypothetical protein
MTMAALAVVAANLKAHMRHLLLRKTTRREKSSVRSRWKLRHPTRPCHLVFVEEILLLSVRLFRGRGVYP